MTVPTLARLRPDLAGAAAGFGIHLAMAAGVLVLAVAGTDGTGADRRMGVQLLVLAGLVLGTPVLLVAGGVLALIRRTRAFGIGLLAGTAAGAALLVALALLPVAAAP
ncbi:hypothetical protein [Hamadaea tsunoensis]|uniref:hypothetical protein n=1 Tax=Hamadaea tsunoensis TaxID=53368 RepID=UPI0003FF77F9|nr:hypothetical protein [Hamadaea tsunoensis]